MRAALAASLVVVAANVAMIVPALRDRATPARTVAMDVCGPHLTGTYGAHDRLRLSVRAELTDSIPGLDERMLPSLGFDAGDLAPTDDAPGRGYQPLPSARRAWVRLVQDSGQGRPWRAVAVGARREDVDGDGLVVRGRVGLVHHVPSGDGRRTVAPALYGTEPVDLYLDGIQGDRLRPLRTTDDRCAAPVRVTLGNGDAGTVWVESVP